MMSFSFHSIAGISAGIISFLAFVPYILSSLRGKNKPNRATWIIWAILGVILLGSYKQAGATHALWLSVANVLAFGAVVIISIRHGEGGWSLLDLSCLAAAGLGLFLWWYFSSPLPALYLSVVIDFIGAIPTLKKSYLKPHEENRIAWILFWIANTINLLALEKWNLAMSLYPLYMFGITGTVALIITFRSHFGEKLVMKS